jgi:glycogen debranching enzyme
VDISRTATTVFDANPATGKLDWSAVRVRAQDARLDRAVDQSLTDLAGLILADPDEPRDVFAAAGTPWFLTLFGRDALWTARMTLPFGTDLALGTLRTLARRQGTRTDPATAEEPGKILHEVRRSAYDDPGGSLHLPPVYFGTVDATPLWVCLLHDAWRWGLPDAEVQTLAPNLERALGWLADAVEQSPDGFLRYVDESGHGLANQGWKDSGDAMRRRDGTVAPAPIALVETQAYAVQAALGAANLREAVLGRSGDDLRMWADNLAARVRASFWSSDADGPYLSMALDGDGTPVDGVGSNMGHVLGTGLLDDEESALVAARLTAADLLGPYGVSTLGRGNPAFNPIGYHTGSVWSHDTAICATGLAAAGQPARAAMVLRALLDAAAHFGYRLPELFGGQPGTTGPVPYPASCRPQAWAAATAGVLVSVALGLEPDAPRDRLAVTPMLPAPFGALTVRGLRVRGAPVAVTVTADGHVTDVVAPSWLTVDHP